MARAAAFTDPLPDEARRIAPRREVTVPVTLSNSAIGRVTAEVVNVSRLGCRVDIRCRFPIDTVLLVTFPGLGPVSGRVIWSRSTGLGLSFTGALSLPIVERLTASFPRRPASEGALPLAEWVKRYG